MSTSDPLMPIQLHEAENAVRNFPGMTTPELAATIGARSVVELGNRLQDLQRVGRVHQDEMHRCRECGQMRRVWRAGPGPDDAPPELSGAYANALDAMSVPVDPIESTTAADAATEA